MERSPEIVVSHGGQIFKCEDYVFNLSEIPLIDKVAEDDTDQHQFSLLTVINLLWWTLLRLI